MTASSVGVWCFRAEYVPDRSNYTGSSDSSHTECFTVRDSASLSSVQDWLPNETATVTRAGGTALTGTLTVALHEGTDCSGAAVAGQTYTFNLNGEASGTPHSTNNSTPAVPASTSVSWKLTFTPAANSFVDAPPSSHREVTSLTITN